MTKRILSVLLAAILALIAAVSAVAASVGAATSRKVPAVAAPAGGVTTLATSSSNAASGSTTEGRSVDPSMAIYQQGVNDFNAGNYDRALQELKAADAAGNMKAGRYISVIYLMKAAEAGDLTSQIALGDQYASGTILPYDAAKAKEWYGKAIAQDHQKQDGTMLAAGANLGMGELLLSEGDSAAAQGYLTRAASTGDSHVKEEANRVLKVTAVSPQDLLLQYQKASDSELQRMLEEDVPKFKQETYKDPKTGKSITYNLYLPDNYDASKKYPMVVFIADASCVSSNPKKSLTQGRGALVWADAKWQKDHPCIVLVPTYTETIIDDNKGKSEITDYVDMTKDLINKVSRDHAVDPHRIYGTGQSMGCMTNMVLMARYPDLYAACMFVDGQWDAETLKTLAGQKFVYFAAAGDEKASTGMKELEAKFNQLGTPYSEATWDATWSDAQKTSAAKKLFAKGTGANMITWKRGTVVPLGADTSTMGAGEHMFSFDEAYKCTAVMEWMFKQSK